MSQFQQVQVRKPTKSKFNLSHEKKLSCNMSELIPIYLQEVLPGDKFRVSSEILMRLAPMVAPVMHRVNVYTHYFFVPNRIVWDEWEDFITGGEDGSLAPVAPFLQISSGTRTNYLEGMLSDYLGIRLS